LGDFKIGQPINENLAHQHQPLVPACYDPHGIALGYSQSLVLTARSVVERFPIRDVPLRFGHLPILNEIAPDSDHLYLPFLPCWEGTAFTGNVDNAIGQLLSWHRP
jgi:hypothetical protein